MRVIYFEWQATPVVEIIIDGTGDQLHDGFPKNYVGLSDGTHNLCIELTPDEATTLRFTGALQIVDASGELITGRVGR